MFSVDVLMQAIEVVRTILQQERCGFCLTCIVAAVEKRLVCMRVADVDPHCLVPAIGDVRERRVEGRSEVGDALGNRIGEVLVFASSITMTFHHDPAAKESVPIVRRHQLFTLLDCEHGADHGTTEAIEICSDIGPIEAGDSVLDPVGIG